MEPPTIGKSTAAENNVDGGGGGNNKKKKKMRNLPSPKEMVSQYEAQGMAAEEASLKVIEDLQNVLVRMAVTSREKGAGTTSRKLDLIYSKLMSLDMKLDSKPSYPQSLAIGVTSGAIVQLFPQLAAAAAGIWNAVRSATKSNP